MKKLPIGIQDFKELREKGFLYVDKTPLIYEMVSGSKAYFLSRPRRFGKSLLVSTLKELFCGNQALFQDLWIEDKIDWIAHPVVHLSFAKGDFRVVGLRAYLQAMLKEIAQEKEVDFPFSPTDRLGGAVEWLIKKLHQKYEAQVVLLIDEYDKPIIDFLSQDELPIAEQNREIMKEFYSPLKDLDPHLRFFFLTGVSKFSKMSVFSELNNLYDLSLSRIGETLLGYTEAELELYFEERIAQIAQNQRRTVAQMRQDIREWYNGYSFGGERLYNPFSILNFMMDQKFNNYWFETGIPTFLVKQMAERQYYDVSEIEMDSLSLGSFDISNIHPLVVLFQTGFLTLKERTFLDVYRLGYPNMEVRNTMLRMLLAEYAHTDSIGSNALVVEMKRSFEQDDLEGFFTHLNGLFAKIPYQIFEERKESYYHAIIFLTFTLLGFYAEAEVSTARGRIDALVRTARHLYIFKFKVNERAEKALEQIKTKGYAEKYAAEGRQIFLIGVACNQKMIEEYVVEMV
ncbi:MAG: ATP-binding protein [Microscillaceae bacterium]|nr:ATP-binding protein [Microscillaceae bacterium]